MSFRPSSDQPAARGAPSVMAQNRDALPPGTRVGEYRLDSVIGEGGFGIVYLATDTTLGRPVAIKEYLPTAYAGRGEGQEVSLRAALHADDYGHGLQSFIREARLLAQFDHPALVRVLRFWEANRTAYMVMPYYEGQTLMAVRRAMQRPPDEAWLRRLLQALGGALEVLHGASCIHRDIAPDNVMVLPGGQPVLLDFSAARHLRLDATHQLTAILKPSYAPIEQYAETSDLRQGPWTDVYALAATARYCILGHAPPPSTVRAVRDRLEPLPQAVAALHDQWPDLRYSLTLMAAIDRGLSVRPQDRPQTVAGFLEQLDLATPAREAAAPPYSAGTPAAPPAEREALRAMFDAVPPGDGEMPDWARTPATRPPAGAPRTRPGAPRRRTGPRPPTEPRFGPPGDERGDPPGHAGGHYPFAEDPAVTLPSDWRTASQQRRRKRLSVGWAVAAAVVATAAAWGWQWREELRADQAMVAVAASMRPDAGVRIADDPIAAIAARVGALGQPGAPEAPQAAASAALPAVPPEAPADPDAGSRIDPAEAISAAAGEELIDAAPRPAPRGAEAVPAPATPREACGMRSDFALYYCMQTQCKQGRYSAHPQCRDLRERDVVGDAALQVPRRSPHYGFSD